MLSTEQKLGMLLTALSRRTYYHGIPVSSLYLNRLETDFNVSLLGVNYTGDELQAWIDSRQLFLYRSMTLGGTVINSRDLSSPYESSEENLTEKKHLS